MIRHVLNVTGHDSIQYVGLSMGTTGFMVAANEHPEFMERSVKMAHLTAPVAYVAHMRAPFVVLLPFSRLIEVGGIVSKRVRKLRKDRVSMQRVLEDIGYDEWVPNGWLLSTFGR